jgi:disulfide bond formation protein DsbB
MGKHIWVKGAKDTALVRIGLGFAATGAVMAGMGVSILFHAARGGLGLAIICIAVALLGFFIAGYMFWAYWWIKAHPEEVKKRVEGAYGQGSWQEDLQDP